MKYADWAAKWLHRFDSFIVKRIPKHIKGYCLVCLMPLSNDPNEKGEIVHKKKKYYICKPCQDNILMELGEDIKEYKNQNDKI